MPYIYQHLYLTCTWNDKLHSTWKDERKSSRPSAKEKPLVGIFGGIFPVTDQFHHLIGLDPGRHLNKNALQSPLIPLHYKTGQVNIPFLSKLGCVYRFLCSPAPHGAHFETLLVGKETRNISCMKLQSTNQYVSINEPGFHTLCCLYSAGKQFSIKAN